MVSQQKSESCGRLIPVTSGQIPGAHIFSRRQAQSTLVGAIHESPLQAAEPAPVKTGGRCSATRSCAGGALETVGSCKKPEEMIIKRGFQPGRSAAW